VPNPTPHLLVTPGPHAVGSITDQNIERIGHFPHREAPGTDTVFGHRSLVIVVAGHGRYHCADGTILTIGPGSMWCINPGNHYRYGPLPGSWWDEYFIDIAGPGIARWYDRGWLVDDPRVFRLHPVGPLVTRIEAIIRVMREGSAAARDRAILLTEQLLFEMYRARSGADAHADDPHGNISGALAHIHAHYADDLDFARLARDHGLSLSVLRRGILALTGKPAATYLRDLRCEIAKKLLSETAMPVARVAREVGIPATVVFTRIFRRYAGMVPTRWRRRSTLPPS
jgi:AraC-like DNA-binding protein